MTNFEILKKDIKEKICVCSIDSIIKAIINTGIGCHYCRATDCDRCCGEDIVKCVINIKEFLESEVEKNESI